MNKDIFKAYDVRGIYPTEIDEKAVSAIMKAYVALIKPKKMAIGKKSTSSFMANSDGVI